MTTKMLYAKKFVKFQESECNKLPDSTIIVKGCHLRLNQCAILELLMLYLYPILKTLAARRSHGE